jgi:electron transfer flavoprotein alpha subunit
VERAGFIAAVDADARAAIVGEADVAVVDDAVAVVEALADIVARERR